MSLDHAMRLLGLSESSTSEDVRAREAELCARLWAEYQSRPAHPEGILARIVEIRQAAGVFVERIPAQAAEPPTVVPAQDDRATEHRTIDYGRIVAALSLMRAWIVSRPWWSSICRSARATPSVARERMVSTLTRLRNPLRATVALLHRHRLAALGVMLVVGITQTTLIMKMPEVAVLHTNHGDIVIAFHAEDAPRSVRNFKRLVREGYYDGTYFHRVVTGTLIQGGDPNTHNADPADDGTGGPPYTIPAEIARPHRRGAVALARVGDSAGSPVDGLNPRRESNGSQFFIDLRSLPALDVAGYTVIGEVLKGMDVVDRINHFGNDVSLPEPGLGGRNPGRRAEIVRAKLVRWSRVVEGERVDSRAQRSTRRST